MRSSDSSGLRAGSAGEISFRPEMEPSFPRRLKPAFRRAGFTAWLKPCPFSGNGRIRGLLKQEQTRWVPTGPHGGGVCAFR